MAMRGLYKPLKNCLSSQGVFPFSSSKVVSVKFKLLHRLTASCSFLNGAPQCKNAYQHYQQSNYSTSSQALGKNHVKELLIPIEYGNIAAKEWGKEGGYPVIAFHGWLDNCGTFDNLLPLLDNRLHVVALDTPGHGKSSHMPLGCHYSYMSLMIDFKKVVDYLGWKKFGIIGHSLGGCLGLFFASIFPQLVEKLVVLDIVKPTSRDLKLFPSITSKGIEVHMANEKKRSKTPPVYTPEAAAKRLQEGMFNEVTLENAKILNRRGTAPSSCGKGVIFSRDLRCRNVEELSRMSHEMMLRFMSAVKCELLMIMANNTHPNYASGTPEVLDFFLETYRENCKKFILDRVDGNHFVHLNNPERIAPQINEFFSDIIHQN